MDNIPLHASSALSLLFIVLRISCPVQPLLLHLLYRLVFPMCYLYSFYLRPLVDLLVHENRCRSVRLNRNLVLRNFLRAYNLGT